MNKSILLTGLAAFTLASAARGQEYRTDINPATQYYQAFLNAPKLSPADYDYINTNEWFWYNRTLPARFGELISQYDNQFKLVRQAGNSTVPCDWGIDFSDGPNTLLLHLAPSKAVAVTAKLRVLWDLQNGNETNAIDDLIATFTLGRNVSRDGTIIGCLVQYADQALVLSSVAANFGRFSPQSLQRLIDGFDAAPMALTLSNSFVNEEKNCSTGWLQRKIVQWQQQFPGDDSKVLDNLHQTLRGYGATNDWNQILAAANGASGGVLKLLKANDPFFQEAANIVALPNSVFAEQAAQFQAQLEAAKATNSLLSTSFDSLASLKAKDSMAQVWLAMVHAAVAYKLQGQAGLRAINDPFGQGPFQFQRFVFNGIDRGFKLTSAFSRGTYPEALIFVETSGTPFRCDGPHIGEGY